jgi:transcriptional regulator with XRE-family HTH domain
MKNNLKLYRTKSGYTQEDISKKIGVSRRIFYKRISLQEIQSTTTSHDNIHKTLYCI